MTITGQLTTHVLNTAQGCPANNMAIELWAIDTQTDQRTLITTAYTNSNGRTDTPLLTGEAFKSGVYELVFAVGEYFNHHISELPEPPFLDRIPLRFGIANSSAHYHVPLLVSPWAYSTYRGS
jgi:5-hydroxyisourate hydrolase